MTDDTELLTGESIQHYLTMIGQLQWLVTWGDLSFIHKSLPCPGSGQLQAKDAWKGYKGSMAMSKDQTFFSQIQN